LVQGGASLSLLEGAAAEPQRTVAKMEGEEGLGLKFWLKDKLCPDLFHVKQTEHNFRSFSGLWKLAFPMLFFVKRR
jgi:hypothetical protein